MSVTPTSLRSSTTSSLRIEKESRKPTTPTVPTFGSHETSETPCPNDPAIKSKHELDWNNTRNTYNPFNWTGLKKWRVTLLACFMTFVIQVNGTMMTSAAEQINESFHISDESFPHSYWPILSWSLGGAAAPLFGLPLMENFGVRRSYMVCCRLWEAQANEESLIREQAIHAVLIIFIVPQAVARNFATLITTRIITGACSGILGNVTSGIVSDIWKSGRSKSFSTSLYIWALLAGLSMGPVCITPHGDGMFEHS
jgi:hypothetical protein